jgi:hypothetical protein
MTDRTGLEVKNIEVIVTYGCMYTVAETVTGHSRPIRELQKKPRPKWKFLARDTWADTTTAQGRLMVNILGSLAEFERELIMARSDGERRQVRPTGKADSASEAGSHQAP